eukprot:105604-Chlamydomonas_euryale.AAC.8
MHAPLPVAAGKDWVAGLRLPGGYGKLLRHVWRRPRVAQKSLQVRAGSTCHCRATAWTPGCPSHVFHMTRWARAALPDASCGVDVVVLGLRACPG